MFSSLWALRFYAQFPCTSGIFKRLFIKFIDKKYLFYYFLITLQNFEVIISSNAVNYICEARMWRLIMNEQSTNNDLTKQTLIFAESFITTLKNKIYKCITSVSKNAFIDKSAKTFKAY